MIPAHISVSDLNEFCKDCMVEHVGIEFVEVGETYLKAKMPVNDKTRQPMGLLHGGASVVLAETLGSIASALTLNQSTQTPVGLEINANHIRSVKDGYVYGTASPIHLGKSTHVWEIKIVTEDDKLVAISRITMAILDKKANG